MSAASAALTLEKFAIRSARAKPDLPRVVARVEGAQVPAEPRDGGEPGEERGRGARRAPGDAGGVAKRLDERRPCHPDADAGAVGDDGDGLAREVRLVDDEVGAGGGETLGEAPAGRVGAGDGDCEARPPAAIDEDGDEAAAAHPLVDGQVRRVRQSGRDLERWAVRREGARPGYIAWETYLRNQEKLRHNLARMGNPHRGPPREGPALLGGLLVCGHCGQRMGPAYGRRGVWSYLCKGDRDKGQVLC